MLDLILLWCGTVRWCDGDRGSPGDFLITAARNGDVRNLKRLVSRLVASVNYRDESAGGASPLYTAAQYGHKDCVEYLLRLKAVVDLPDNNGETALFKAVRRGSEDIVLILVKHGANPNVQNQWGDTCLITASQYGYTAVVQYLVDHGADVHHRNRQGYSALSLARQCQHQEIVEILESHEKGRDKE